MFIESIEKLGKYLYRVKSETEVFYAYQNDLKRYSIREGAEFSDEIYSSFIKEILIPRARKKALDILTGADCSESELRRKLSLKNYSPSVIDDAVNYVKRFNYLNDARYAENYLNYRGRSKSLRQVKMELESKGIDSSVIENLFTDELSDEEALEKLIKKKLKNQDETDEKEIRKVYAYLYRKGFSPELISSKLHEYFSCT